VLPCGATAPLKLLMTLLMAEAVPTVGAAADR